MTYELFQQGPEAYIPYLLLSAVITVILYGAFPFVFAKSRQALITKKKYKWLCYGINAVVMLLFGFFNGEPSNGAPYLLWTWIFSSYGINILGTRGVLSDGDYLKDDPNRITECKTCGYRSKDFFNACPECGKYAKQYVYIKEEKLTDNTKPLPPSKWRCSCGKVHPKYETSCVCGRSRFDNINLPKAEQTTPAATENSPEDEKILFCRKCGEKLLDGSQFCRKCGTEIVEI